MKKEDIPVLDQIIESVGEAMPKLEKYYYDKDYENFSRTKRFILELQKKILEILE